MKTTQRILLAAVLILAMCVPLATCSSLDPMDDIYTKNVYPGASGNYTIGSTLNPYSEGHFHDLYVDNSTLYIGGIPFNPNDYTPPTGGQPNGVSIIWLGTFDIAPTSPSLDNAYRNSTDNTAYVWDGNTWQEMVQDGARGGQGIQGLQGIQGIQGIQGNQGSQGEAGPNVVTASTTTNLTGILSGDGASITIVSNSGILGAIEQAFTTALKSNYDYAYANSHAHSNKLTLDATQEAFTSALKTAYDWLVANITSAWKAAVDNFVASKGVAGGLAPLDGNSKIPTVNLGGEGADGTKYLRGDQTWAVPLGGGNNPTGVFSDIQSSILQSDGTLNAASGVQTWAGTNKTSQDAFTLVANKTYRVRGQWIVNTGATTHTTAMAWSTSATITDFQYLVTLWNAAANTIQTTQSTTHVTGVASKIVNATSTAVYTIISFEGIMVVGNTGGAITPQINFSANPTGTNLMKRGSWISFELLGTDTTTLIGGWS